MTSPPLLEVRSVCKQFPGVRALDDVFLQLHAGEVLAVVGENGAGKSTLMKILAGVYTPDSGEILLNGEPVFISGVNEAFQLGISLIHQELNLAENLSVAANLFLGREPTWGGPLGLFCNTDRETLELLQRVDLNCLPGTIVSALSPGQKQLVEIARSLSLDVRILIMDEPTSSLTQRETETLYHVIADLKRSGVAVVYISHRLAEIEEIADRVVVLRDGKNAGELVAKRKNRMAEPSSTTGIMADDKEAISPVAKSGTTTSITADENPAYARKDPSRDYSPSQVISHENMVRMMVGREASQFFRRQHPIEFGPVRLQLEEVCFSGCPGRRSGVSDPISLEVRGGEILGMAGLVGAGRTELAEAVFGLRPIHFGAIFVDGERMEITSSRKAVKAGLSLVPEDRRYHGLVITDSIRRNIGLSNMDRLNQFGIVKIGDEIAMAESTCERLNVRTPGIGQTVGLLSGGNQQKVVLGKWLARHPRVFIVDEPTRGIDVGAKSEIYALMDELASQGVAIWMISSDLEEILGLSDRVAVLHEGALAGVLQHNQLSEEAVMNLATGG